jgi:hypothetical protein
VLLACYPPHSESHCSYWSLEPFQLFRNSLKDRTILPCVMATKPISTFFSKKSPSGSTKRKADESDRPESGKKAATEAESGSTLSPAEKARVSASKQAALAARAKKTGVPSPGLVAESWAKALKPEVNLRTCLQHSPPSLPTLPSHPTRTAYCGRPPTLQVTTHTH